MAVFIQIKADDITVTGKVDYVYQISVLGDRYRCAAAGGDDLDKLQACAVDAKNGEIAGARVHREQQRVVLTEGQ